MILDIFVTFLMLKEKAMQHNVRYFYVVREINKHVFCSLRQ